MRSKTLPNASNLSQTLHNSLIRIKTLPNAPKLFQTLQDFPKRSNTSHMLESSPGVAVIFQKTHENRRKNVIRSNFSVKNKNAFSIEADRDNVKQRFHVIRCKMGKKLMLGVS